MSTVPKATPTHLDDREEDASESERGTGAVDENEEQEEDLEEDEEPKLKYAKLTGSLPGVYRNGDFTTAFCIAGDKMVVGTQDGNIHVLGLPAMEALRTYHAHSASVTSCSISPIPPPPSMLTMQDGSKEVLIAPGLLSRMTTAKTMPTVASTAKSARAPPPAVPNTPTNQIYVATSSIDGHVCISSLMDPKDVQLRNFARPVQAVALSPDYRADRTYLSGGRAGNLILTVGGKAGVSSDANTNSAVAAASGWLGSIGLGPNNGKDTVLHQGEGSISTIKWSLSGKWVVWVNEEGIKIMRSHLRLDSEASEDAWRRVAHAAKPGRKNWEDMAGVWKSRVEWVDERLLEIDDLSAVNETASAVTGNANGTIRSTKKEKKPEKLVVGWGDTAWIMHVHEGGVVQVGKHAGQKQIGSADIIHKLQFRDCIVSGVTLYTPSMLAILAYRTRDDDDNVLPSTNDTPRKGRQRQHTSLAPQMRLVNVKDGEEVDLDELSVSRFETLSAQDYQLSTLYIPPALPDRATQEQRGALESLWEASGGGYATRLISSGASMLTRSDTDSQENGKSGVASPRGGSVHGVQATIAPRTKVVDAHPYVTEAGLKLFIHSPYDCVLAVKRDLGDHMDWLLEHHHYQQAWQLLNKRPDILDTSTADRKSINSAAGEAPSKGAKGTLADFFADSDSQTTASAVRLRDSATAREKQRIGELWLNQLVAADQWQEAGKVAGTVLEKSDRWEHWVFAFAQAEKFDEITPFVPATMLKPPVPGEVYEIVLGHYLVHDPPRLGSLLDSWDTDLFDAASIVTAIEARLRSGEVSETSFQDGVQGRDWLVLLEALAKLYLANGQARDALQCYIRTQNAEAAMNLIRDEKISEAIVDDIPAFVTLKVSKQQLRSASLSELEETSSEVIDLLAEEALRGSIPTVAVVHQLQQRGGSMQMFLFFYFRALWRGGSKDQDSTPRRIFDRIVEEGHMLVEDHADLAVELFAEYDRTLLLDFLQSSEIYNYDTAIAICEQRHYIPELVHVLGKTGQLKRALWLIIGELGDVVKAISFVKENPDLWEDLLEYGMDKPSFIRGLLEEVGTAVDPVELVRRIPIGLEIPGLKQGLTRLVKEYEIQHSISEGVARVLRGEVTAGMDILRAGQRKAVRFEVVHEKGDEVQLTTKDVPTQVDDQINLLMPKKKIEAKPAKPGHCVGCGKAFHENEQEPLLGFACGHVYHLSCLLRAAKPDAPPGGDSIARQMHQLGYGDDRPTEDQGYGGRSVGAKVAHAHVIGNVVEGGCRRCYVPDGA